MKFEELLHQYYEEANKKENLNMDLLLNNRQESLAEYIIDVLKILERVPNIKIVDWELITDESQFDTNVVNKKHLKTKVKYDKFIPLDEYRYDLLKVHTTVNLGDCIKDKEINLLLPKRYKNYYFMLGGNKFYPIYQLIDSSTYGRKNSIILKPINLKRNKEVIYDTMGDAHDIVHYSIYLFNKKVNTLLYYIAPLGFENMISYLGMNDIIKVYNVDSEEVFDKDRYSFRTKLGIRISVLKKFLEEDPYTQSCVYQIITMIDEAGIIDLEELEDRDLWTSVLGSHFTTTDATLEKGKSVLISFKEIATPLFKSNLKLDWINKDSTHAVVRWLMRNFNALKIKDNLDIKNKRIRMNEYIAEYFAQVVNKKLNRFLNTPEKKIQAKDLNTLVTYGMDDVIKKLMSSKSPLLRYNNSVNDLDFFTAFKYSIKGPSSLGENSKSVPIHYRAIHHSHLGCIDITSSSATDPGITGYFTPFADTKEGKFFNNELEPQNWVDNFETLRQNYFENSEIPYVPLKTMDSIEKKSRKFLKSIQNIDEFIDNYSYKKNDDGTIKLLAVNKHKNIKMIKLDIDVEPMPNRTKRKLFTKL